MTHPYPTNAKACLVYTRLIVLSLDGKAKAQLEDEAIKYQFQDPDLKARFAKYTELGSFSKFPEAEIKSSGYVISTLKASLWSLFTTDSFRNGAICAVNLGMSVCLNSNSCYPALICLKDMMPIPLVRYMVALPEPSTALKQFLLIGFRGCRKEPSCKMLPMI